MSDRDLGELTREEQEPSAVTFSNKKPTVTELVAILEADKALCDSITFDAFQQRRMVSGFLPWDGTGDVRPWTPHDDVQAFAYVQGYRPRAARQDVADALMIHERAHERDPLKELLLMPTESGGLPPWDGTPRVETMLIDLLGAQDTPYVRHAWSTFMCSAFMRAIRPGCKADLMAILYGTQGIGKSTFCKKLAIRPEWYLSGPRDLSDTANMARELSGKLIAEQEELAGFSKRDIETLKAAISRTHDTYVDKYQTTPTERPRRSVFVGTTNSRQVLRDATGNRRYVIFECGAQPPIVSIFDDDGDHYIIQAWAELSWRYRAQGGKPFRTFLSPECEDDAEQVRHMFTEVDTLADTIISYVSDYGGNRLCATQIVVEALDMSRELASKDRQLQRRVVETLDHRCVGWKRSERKQRIAGYGIVTCWERIET